MAYKSIRGGVGCGGSRILWIVVTSCLVQGGSMKFDMMAVDLALRGHSCTNIWTLGTDSPVIVTNFTTKNYTPAVVFGEGKRRGQVRKMPGAPNKGVACMVGTGKKGVGVLFKVRELCFLVSSLKRNQWCKGGGGGHDYFL